MDHHWKEDMSTDTSFVFYNRETAKEEDKEREREYQQEGFCFQDVLPRRSVKSQTIPGRTRFTFSWCLMGCQQLTMFSKSITYGKMAV